MKIEITSKDKATVISLAGRLDAITVAELDKALQPTLDGGQGPVLLSLEELEYVSSAGLRCILSTLKKLESKKRRLALTGVRGMVKEVLDMSGLSSLLSIHATAEEALRAG